MLRVKVKSKNKRMTIPIPYVILNLAGLFITSKRMNRFINKAIEKDGSKFILPKIEKNDLKPLLQEFSNNKGIVLVNTKLKDGIEVEVKL